MSKPGSLGVAGLTPLLDTLFLLLFALLALTQSRTTGRNDMVRVQLPAVATGSGATSMDTKFVRVTVDADGTVTVEGRQAPLSTLAELDPALSAVLGDAVPESVRVEIVADNDAPYGVAVTLLQHLRSAGFSRVGLLARQVDQPTLPARGSTR